MAASPTFPKLPSHWKSQGGFEKGLHYKIWQNPNSQTGRAIFLVHGYGEHSGRYEHFPFYLNNEVDLIFAWDLPGHGQSTGPRGHANHFNDLTSAAVHMLQYAQIKSPDLNWNFVGHSMGGLIVLHALMTHSDLPISKASVSAPYIDLAQPVSPLKQAVGLAIEPFLPRLALKSPIDLNVLSHDLEVVKAYATDPLNHAFITPRLYKTLLQTQAYVKNWSGILNYSIQFLIPLADPLVSWKTSFQLAKNLQVASGKTKEVQTFPNFFHEGFNELDKGRYFNALCDWLKR